MLELMYLKVVNLGLKANCFRLKILIYLKHGIWITNDMLRRF